LGSPTAALPSDAAAACLSVSSGSSNTPCSTLSTAGERPARDMRVPAAWPGRQSATSAGARKRNTHAQSDDGKQPLVQLALPDLGHEVGDDGVALARVGRGGKHARGGLGQRRHRLLGQILESAAAAAAAAV
jgi:hypothetical protein